MRKLFFAITCTLSFCIGFCTNGRESGEDVVRTVEVITVPYIESLTTIPNNIVDIGICKISAYCREDYPHICNDGDSTITATGTTPTVGRTIAVDPSVIPYGSVVVINGHEYVAEDTMSQRIKDLYNGRIIDIYFDDHDEAWNFGVQYAEVFLKGETK
jgi:3D (Asp-Asp-Asp) domain-containing protein